MINTFFSSLKPYFTSTFTRISIADIFQTKKRRKKRATEEIKLEEMMLDYEENDAVEYTTVIGDLDSEVESATAITEEEDDYYDDFWAGEYDEYRDVAAVVAPPERINFRKYGRRAGNSTGGGGAADLPRGVYCDLVTTLNSKCVQTSLLEMWRYDRNYIQVTHTALCIEIINI